jgi:outer membrane biosynthesis protein TonB
MKLPASVLAALCLTGVAACETTVDFERRSAPPVTAPTATEKGNVERVEIELGRVEHSYAKPPPGAAPITKPTPTPKPIAIKRVPKPAPKPQANACGPCGMG